MTTADVKRKKLLEMARSGQPRPSSGSTALGQSLVDYTCPTKDTYNLEFDTAIRQLRPDWFINTADVKRAELLELAKNGKPRPHRSSPLGRMLKCYISRSSECYNAEFDSEIRSIRPDWFLSPKERKAGKKNKKQELLGMAKNKEPKPIQGKHNLGGVLKSYTCRSHRQYDQQFDETIRQLRPDWFANTADENKKLLLEMAENNSPRPHFRNDRQLYRLFKSYITKSQHSYDSDFCNRIRQLRPEWLVNTANENKRLLLEMARSGKSRPSGNLSASLGSYINKSQHETYDSEFDEAIRQLRPDWFANTADENKQRLLEMARNGEPRPSSRDATADSTYTLGAALIGYTCDRDGSGSYNPEFDKEIRTLRPDWFVKDMRAVMLNAKIKRWKRVSFFIGE